MGNMVHWTDQELSILRAMTEAGKKSEEISQVLVSRTVEAINNKASQLGLSMAGKPKINFDAFKEMMKGLEVKCL